jgi:membrane-bound serine protease (ClpP class)
MSEMKITQPRGRVSRGGGILPTVRRGAAGPGPCGDPRPGEPGGATAWFSDVLCLRPAARPVAAWRARALRWLPALAAGLLAWPASGAGAQRVDLIDISGPIGPASAEYLSRATRVAGADHAQCLVVRLDTPGGLLDSMKDIVQAIYASPVPVVVYVARVGARAGSAGCFITLAADVAAMAPHGNIGAAHPVELGGLVPAQTDDVMAKKLESYGASYIEAIANKHERNAEWAKSAVRESASVTSERALELKVIDLIARDVPDLMAKIDGRVVRGTPLATARAQVAVIPLLARERLFQTLWRPEVMFLLMLIAVYGIIGELSSPGAVLPGVAGAIALILLLYMASIVPINIAGVALVVLSIILFVIDVFAPTHGVLTFGAIASFFLGSLLVFDRAGSGFQLSLATVVPATITTAVFFLFVVGAGLRAQRAPVRAGPETMIGRVVEAQADIGRGAGRVLVEGEIWAARSDEAVAQGQPVEIVGIDGLVLKVKPKK